MTLSKSVLVGSSPTNPDYNLFTEYSLVGWVSVLGIEGHEFKSHYSEYFAKMAK